MKKIVLTLILAAFAFAANAQIVISANIGGMMTSGNTHTFTHTTIVTDSTASLDVPMETATSYTAGLKFGYKFAQKFQVGVAGVFTSTIIKDQPLDPTFIPMISNSVPSFITIGTMSTKNMSFSVCPYFRYDFLQAGDVSLFVELNGFYTKTMNPIVNAEVHNLSLTGFTLDTVFTDIPRPTTTTGYGVFVVPGLSWQLSKHCGIDLYMDFLAMAYSVYTTVDTQIRYTFKFTNLQLSYETDMTTYTTTQTEMGATITGTPLLTTQGVNNWVRAGFNFTF